MPEVAGQPQAIALYAFAEPLGAMHVGAIGLICAGVVVLAMTGG